MKRYYATGSDWKIEEHIAGDLVRLSDHIAEIERLRKLYDAAWAECEATRAVLVPGTAIDNAWREPRHADPDVHDDLYFLVGESREAHDTARKENANGNA